MTAAVAHKRSPNQSATSKVRPPIVHSFGRLRVIHEKRVALAAIRVNKEETDVDVAFAVAFMRRMR